MNGLDDYRRLAEGSAKLSTALKVRDRHRLRRCSQQGWPLLAHMTNRSTETSDRLRSTKAVSRSMQVLT
jgi:hypothetical protein